MRFNSRLFTCFQPQLSTGFILLLAVLYAIVFATPVQAQQGCTIITSALQPAAGAVVSHNDPLTLEISISSNDPNCTHTASGWEVASDPSFDLNTLVYSTPFSSVVDLTSSTVSAGTLQPGTQYWWAATIQTEEFGIFQNYTIEGTFSTAQVGGACAANDMSAPQSLSPSNNSTVSATPTLEIDILLFVHCNIEGTWWQVSEDSNFSSGISNFDRRISFNEDIYLLPVPAGSLDEGKTYYWRAQFFSIIGNSFEYGALSQTYSFTVQSSGPSGGPCVQNDIPTPWNFEPNDGATVSLTPTLGIASLIPNCDLHGSWWEFSKDPNFGVIDAHFIHETALGENLYELTVPAGALEPNTTYYWRVAFFVNVFNQQRIFGNDTAATSIRTQAQGGGQQPGGCNALPTPIISSPANDATIQSLTPTLRVDYSSNPGNCVDGSLWWLSDDPNFNPNIAYYDGDIAMGRDPLSWTIPAGVLEAGKTYYWVVWFYEATTPTNFGPESQVVRFTTAASGGGNPPVNPPVNPPTNPPKPPTNPPTNPPGGGSSTLTIPQAVAQLVPSDPNRANADQIIGDREIKQAITMWIFGSPVPNTGNQTIGDSMMIDLIKTWIGGMPVTTQGAVPVSNAYARAELNRLARSITSASTSHVSVAAPLTLSAVRLQTSGFDRWTLSMDGSGIAAATIQVFDTSGRLLINQHTEGQQLTLLAQDDDGHHFANGVYLYVVTVHDRAGNAVRSEIGKWIVLR